MLSAVRARQLFAIHRWTGLLTGLVILFLSVTGAGLVFVTEIDRLLNRELLVAAPAGERILPERALAAVRERYPDAEIGRLELPQTADGVYTTFVARLPGSGFNQLMVNPYTGVVLGGRDLSASFAFILRQLHLRFYKFQWQGRVVVGSFGLLLLVSTVTGLFIYSRFIRALPRWWSIRRGRSVQITTSDWHKLIGIVALAFNLVIAFTGTVLGLENLVRYSEPAKQAIHPSPPKEALPEPPASLEGIVGVSAVLAAARAAIPDLAPLAVNLPLPEKRHYTVYGNHRRARRLEMAGASSVVVHALTGHPVHVHNTAHARAITKAYNWMDPLHFGYWGGVWSQIVYVVFGLTTGFLSVTGFMVWYLKKARRQRAAAMRAAA